jgi:hypothetical protein
MFFVRILKASSVPVALVKNAVFDDRVREMFFVARVILKELVFPVFRFRN